MNNGYQIMIQNNTTRKKDENKGANKNCIKKKISDRSLIRQIIIDKGKVECTNKNYIMIFVREGTMKFEWKGRMNIKLSKGDFFVLPPGSIIKLVSDTRISLFICQLEYDLCFCEELELNKIHKRFPRNFEKHSILQMNRVLEAFIENFVYCIEEGISCDNYVKIKIKELMCLLRVSYSTEELSSFLGSFLNEDFIFKSFVLANWNKVKSVEEFARLANYSRETFTRKFQQVMHKSPMAWMKEEKASLICHDLVYSKKPLKQISEDYGFSSTSVLNQFCLKYLKDTPAKIRKNGNNII